MAEIAYYEVWQDEALVYESRGIKFPKGKPVKVISEKDIEAFTTDGTLQIRAVSVVRKKAAPKIETEPETTSTEKKIAPKVETKSTAKKTSTSKKSAKRKKG